MECNKEEAVRAMDIAKRKVAEKDYNGAKKFATKAQDLYPELDGLKQVLMLIDVYISAGNKISGGDCDWYGILGVDPLADDQVVKKQYRKLALLLHPDKNKCEGAEGAFKLVLEAWCILSDKVKRIAYDQKWKSKEVKPKKTRKQKQPPNQPKQPPKQQKQPNQPRQPPKQQNQQPNQPPKQQKQPQNQPPKQQKQPQNQPPKQQKQPPNQPKQPPKQQKKPPNQPKQPSNQQKQPPNQQKQPPNQEKQPPSQEKQPLNQEKQPPNQEKQPPSQEKQPPNQQKQPANQNQQSPNKPSSNAVRNGRGRSNKPTPKVSTFWTMCNKCRTQYEYVRVYYLNKNVLCRNCRGTFKATEKEKTPQATSKNTNGAHSCGRDSSLSKVGSFNSENVANQGEERTRRGTRESQENYEEAANSGFRVEERVFKKLRTDDYAEASSGIKV